VVRYKTRTVLRYFYRFLVWFLMVLGSNGALSTPPNILLIYVDDLGYGDLGSYGHPVIQTPNIDKLAADGLRLTSFYAPSALCSPSRAGLLTGRHPYRTGITSWIPHDSGVFLRSEEVTLAETLKAVDYQTAHIGKWHLNSDLGSKTETQPTDQGFDYFYGHNAFQIPTNKNPTNIYRDGVALPEQEGYTADLYATEAIQWLDRRDPKKPFFLYLGMAEPHVTIENPDEYNAMYSQYTNGPIVPIRSEPDGPPKDKLKPRGPGEYYANITYMDVQLGRVLDWLDENGAAADTVVVFASDNGPVTSDWLRWFEVNAYGDTGGFRGRKHYLYEGGIRVPAVIRYPGHIEPGMTSDAPIIGTDLFVTLTKLGGGDVPADRPIDGVDIAPVLAGEAMPERSLFWALSSISEIEFALRRGEWKLLSNKKYEPVALFNLVDDPLEFFNLLEQQPQIAGELNQKLKQNLSSIRDDPFLPNKKKMKFRFAQ
jgi:arylsulfatase A-like enzyme